MRAQLREWMLNLASIANITQQEKLALYETQLSNGDPAYVASLRNEVVSEDNVEIDR